MAQHVFLGGVGLIPTWQFDTDPRTNRIGQNAHVRFPEGMTQQTVQPVGYYAGSGEAELQGLGARRDHRRATTTYRAAGSCPPGWEYDRVRNICVDASDSIVQRRFNGPGLGFFDSAWWQQRKWIAFGLLGVLGIGAAALATKVLR